MSRNSDRNFSASGIRRPPIRLNNTLQARAANLVDKAFSVKGCPKTRSGRAERKIVFFRRFGDSKRISG
ncbi:hypothetical protein CDO73_04410 [Saccharibacillus sp. O23]|nr:hypothetical protein CDO73_04410 [Saccharibacillus sp. O23]